jgi:hypothetical protein
VQVADLTTPTELVTAQPHGGFLLSESLLPTRVSQGRRWVGVSTVLQRDGRMLSAQAVPGDQVLLSTGGRGPLAVVATGRSGVQVWWPGNLPSPSVSGSSATYRDVLPGVDLVVSATAAAGGGFSAVLVIRNRAAAADQGLRDLALRVSAKRGTLAPRRGGGVQAEVPQTGTYTVAPAQMWDSSVLSPRVLLGRDSRQARAAVASAQAVGAQVAAPGTGPSGVGGPAGGSRVAPVAVRVSGGDGGGSRFSVLTDAAMLASPSTVFPVYTGIASGAFSPAGSQLVPVEGDKQHYVEVQSACPNATNEDNQNNYHPNPYWSLGVGYDAYPGGDCDGNSGYTDAYYQLAVPSELDNAVLEPGSTFQSWETYSATCSSSASTAVTLDLTAGINAQTSWNSIHADSDTWNITYVDRETMGPDTASNDSNCDTSDPVDDTKYCTPNATPGDCPNNEAAVFQLGTSSAVADALTMGASQVAFRLFEPDEGDASKGNGNDFYWKRFNENPWMEVYYDQYPSRPSGTDISIDGSNYHACNDMTATGLTTTGVTMRATFNQPGVNNYTLTPSFQYKAGSGSWQGPLTGAPVTPGGKSTQLIPAKFLNAQSPGTVISWEANSTDGTLTSSWSVPCTFTVYPSAPPPPTIGEPGSPTGCPSGTKSGTIGPGCQLSFTVTSNDTSQDPAVTLVWGLDGAPAPVNPPASETLSFGSKTSLKVTITVPSPGPHQLEAYIVDSGGNNSGDANPEAFAAAADPWTTPFASFSAALSGSYPFDNTMISTEAGQSGGADGDGSPDSIDEQLLSNAGWQPNSTVTIDGATFKLPDFGSKSSGPDNILAAGQTIDLPSGSQGSSLVFLATSTNADAQSPLYKAANWPGSDYTAPYVPGNTAVTGVECDPYQSAQGACEIPSGSISYYNPPNNTQTPAESYFLTVPDWISGSTFDSAITTYAEDQGTSQNASNFPMIYAFAVPLNPQVPVTSVTLPDIGDYVDSASGVGIPALHIFGIAVANTTTATPGTTEGALTSGQTWTGAWESPVEQQICSIAGPCSVPLGPATYRMVATVSAGGPDLRLRLSNDQSNPQDQNTGADSPLDIGAVTVAQTGNGAAVTAGTVTPVTFGSGNSTTVNIPDGGDVYSNPISPEGFSLTAGSQVTVSVYLSNAPLQVTTNQDCSACAEYEAWSGNHVSDTSGSAFGSASQASYILSGIDVQTAGIPTVVVAGDNVITTENGTDTVDDAAPRVADDLAAAEIAAGQNGVPAFSVVSAGISTNDVLNDGSATNSGPSLLTRLAPDVLTEPNVGTVIVDEGLQDLIDAADGIYSGPSTTYNDLTQYRYPELFSQLQAWGISAIAASLTPCYGMSGGLCTAAATGTTDAYRLGINQFMSDNYNVNSGQCPTIFGACLYFADFDGQVAVNVTDGSTLVEQLAPGDREADYVNLTTGGYTAIASAVPPAELTPNVPPDY